MSTNGNDTDNIVYVYSMSKNEPGHMTCEEVKVLDTIGSSCTVRIPLRGDIPIAVIPGKAYNSYGGFYTVLRSRNDNDARLIFARYCRSMVTYLKGEIDAYLDTAVEILKGVDQDLRGDI